MTFTIDTLFQDIVNAVLNSAALQSEDCSKIYAVLSKAVPRGREMQVLVHDKDVK